MSAPPDRVRSSAETGCGPMSWYSPVRQGHRRSGRRSNAPDDTPDEDIVHPRQGTPRDLRNALGSVVVLQLGGFVAAASDDDSPHHAGVLMRNAEVVVDALDRQRDRECLVRQQVVGAPGFGALRNPEWALDVGRMIGRRRMG